jgi:hypothetical protein
VANLLQKPATVPFLFHKIVLFGLAEHLRECEGSEVCFEGLRLLGQAFAVPIEVEGVVGEVTHKAENLHPPSPSSLPKSQTKAQAKTFAISSVTSLSSPPHPFAWVKGACYLVALTKSSQQRQKPAPWLQTI